MAANDYAVVSVTTGGNTSRIKPEVTDKIYRAYSDRNAALTVVNKFFLKSKGANTVKNQDQTVQHSWPLQKTVTVTAAATLAATSITVDDSGYTREGDILFDPETGQRVECSSNPTSATVIPVTALGSAISAYAKLIRVAKMVGESWSRPKPLSRDTEQHHDYTGTFQHSWAWSWHKEHTGHYGPPEKIRIETDGMDEFDEMINKALILNEPADGSSSGKYKNAGLLYMGEKYGYKWVPEVITAKTFGRMLYHFRKHGGPNPMISAILPHQLYGDLSFSGLDSRIVQTADMNPAFGADKPKDGKTQWGFGVKWMPDLVMDNEGIDDKIILVNWSVVEPMEFGSILIQKPDSANPQGVADVGSGDMQSMVTRAVGFRYNLPIGACMVIDNVKRFELR